MRRGNPVSICGAWSGECPGCVGDKDTDLEHRKLVRADDRPIDHIRAPEVYQYCSRCGSALAFYVTLAPIVPM